MVNFDVLICPAALESLPRVIAYVEECAGRCALAGPKTARLTIAVEEAFVNICHYAYPDGKGDVAVACAHDARGPRAFTVELKDKGAAFDPLALRPPAESDDILDRPVGGLGVAMMRRFCDEVVYRREGEWNFLRLVVVVPQAAEPLS